MSDCQPGPSTRPAMINKKASTKSLRDPANAPMGGRPKGGASGTRPTTISAVSKTSPGRGLTVHIDDDMHTIQKDIQSAPVKGIRKLPRTPVPPVPPVPAPSRSIPETQSPATAPPTSGDIRFQIEQQKPHAIRPLPSPPAVLPNCECPRTSTPTRLRTISTPNASPPRAQGTTRRSRPLPRPEPRDSIHPLVLSPGFKNLDPFPLPDYLLSKVALTPERSQPWGTGDLGNPQDIERRATTHPHLDLAPQVPSKDSLHSRSDSEKTIKLGEKAENIMDVAIKPRHQLNLLSPDNNDTGKKGSKDFDSIFGSVFDDNRQADNLSLFSLWPSKKVSEEEEEDEDIDTDEASLISVPRFLISPRSSTQSASSSISKVLVSRSQCSTPFSAHRSRSSIDSIKSEASTMTTTSTASESELPELPIETNTATKKQGEADGSSVNVLQDEEEAYVDYAWVLSSRVLYRHQQASMNPQFVGKWALDKNGKRVTQQDFNSVLKILRTL